MARRTRTITISAPPEMADTIDALRREESRTTSELLREALRRYIEDRNWQRLYRYGERKAQERGITTEEQVDDLIHARHAAAN